MQFSVMEDVNENCLISNLFDNLKIYERFLFKIGERLYKMFFF